MSCIRMQTLTQYQMTLTQYASIHSYILFSGTVVPAGCNMQMAYKLQACVSVCHPSHFVIHADFVRHALNITTVFRGIAT